MGLVGMCDWKSTVFDEILRGKESKESTESTESKDRVIRPPNTLVTNGLEYHLRFEALVPAAPQYNDDGSEKPPAPRIYNHNYAISRKHRRGRPMTTVAQLMTSKRKGGWRGVVDGRALHDDICRLMETAGEDSNAWTEEQKAAAELLELLCDEDGCIGGDPGVEPIIAFSNGSAILRGDLYGGPRRKPYPKLIQDVLQLLSQHTLNTAQPEALARTLDIRRRWVPVLVDYFASNSACQERRNRTITRESKADKVISGVLRRDAALKASDARKVTTRYSVLYLGNAFETQASKTGNTAGPSKVKGMRKLLGQHLLVVLSTC